VANDYQELSQFVHANAADPVALAKILTAWQWASLLPGGAGKPPVVPQDVPTVLNASCGWREWLTTVLFQEIGIKERQVNFYDVPFQGGHTCVELFINNKWMFFDPTFGTYFESVNGGNPLSIQEARNNWPNIVVKQAMLPGWQGTFLDPDTINPATAFQSITDPFLYLPKTYAGVANVVGGELWSLYFGPNAAYYDGLNDTFLPSARKWITTEDPGDIHDYRKVVDYYDPQGNLDFRYGFYDAGGTFFIDYDQKNQFAWKTKTTDLDIHNVNHFTFIEYDDGSRGTVGTPADETILGGAANETFAGMGGNDLIDGGGGKDTFEFKGARSSYTVIDNGIAGLVVTGQDGRDTLFNAEYLKFSDQILPLTARTVTVQDGNGNFAWTDNVTSFDADDRRISIRYDNDDGSHTVYSYDALDQFRWESVETQFDALWRRPQILYSNDDGSSAVYQYDIMRQYAWSRVLTEFDEAGAKSAIHYQNDDRTAVVYPYDVNGQFSWSQTARYFNAAGQKTADVYDNDIGTHTAYGYDPVTGAITSVHQFNAGWDFIA